MNVLLDIGVMIKSNRWWKRMSSSGSFCDKCGVMTPAYGLMENRATKERICLECYKNRVLDIGSSLIIL